MHISQLKVQFQERLKDDYPVTEIESFFYILSEFYLGLRRIDMAMDPDLEISETQNAKFEKALLRLKDHEPVQYITGKTEFYNLEFFVDRNVLIPRPETEELVDWIIEDHRNNSKKFRILDVGSGSGCIPVSIAKNLPNAEVQSFDVSIEAINLAVKNAGLNNVVVDFSKVDILALDRLDKQYDVIVSNPPYVREREKMEMHQNVLKHEPDLALYVSNDNPLVFYEKITRLAANGLNDGGCLYFEINQYLAEETKTLVENLGFEGELKKDIFGNYRMLKATRK